MPACMRGCHLKSHGRHQQTEALSSSLSHVAAGADPFSLPPPQPEPRIKAPSQQGGCHLLSLPYTPHMKGLGKWETKGRGREDREGQRGGGRRGKVTPVAAASCGGNLETLKFISPRLRIPQLQLRAHALEAPGSVFPFLRTHLPS